MHSVSDVPISQDFTQILEEFCQGLNSKLIQKQEARDVCSGVHGGKLQSREHFNQMGK